MRTLMKPGIGITALVAAWVALPVAGFAAPCRDTEYLKVIGRNTNDAVLTSAAAEVRLISMTCDGTTACQAGLYNGTVQGDAVAANLVIEPSGSTTAPSTLTPETGFFDPPLSFPSGVVFVDSGNVSTITIFACVERP